MRDKKDSKLLQEDAQFGNFISSDEIGEYFVGPIMDVFKVAKIALKDIGKGALYNVRIAFTISTTKKARLLKAYKQSKENIDKEYGQIMPRIDKNLGEAKALFMAANPVGFLSFYAIKSGIDTTKWLGEVFVEQQKAIGGEGPNEPTKPEDGPILGALGDLKRIFFGESYVVGAILEAAEDGKETVDVEAEVRTGLEKLGVDPEDMISKFKDWASAKKEIINSVNEEGLPARMAALGEMMKSEELDSLKKSVDAAKAAGVDLGNYIADFEKEYEEQKNQLIKALQKEKGEGDEATGEDTDQSTEDAKKQESLNPKKLLESEDKEILSKVKELPDIKKLGDDAKEEDYLKALEGSLFMTLKANLQEDGEKIMGEIKGEIGELVQIVTGPFENETEINEFSQASPEADAISKEMLNCFKQLTGK